MSCSLVEAKFQVLDQAIRMLSKSKSLRSSTVSSSEHLRELVDNHKPTSLLPVLNPVKGVVMTRSNLTRCADKGDWSRPNTCREEERTLKREASYRFNTGREPQDKWIDPKQQRAEQLLQDTWHEIESAANWGDVTESSKHEKQLKSKLLDECAQDDRVEQENAQYEPCESNQANEETGSFNATVHNALPPPKRPLTSSGLQPKKTRASSSARCRSASNSDNNSGHQPKNWFVPSSPPKRKHCRSIAKAMKQKQVKLRHQHRRHRPPETDEIVTSNLQVTPKIPIPKSDDLSFYMLELRLVHPDPLAEWRFQASFTDTSVSPSKTVIVDNLTVDRENCLLFEASQPGQPTTFSRFFNPFLYFPGLNRPSDLYGHVLRILVTSTTPVTKIVINTTVQFTRFPDESVVQPPELPRKRSEDLAVQEESLLRVLTRRNSSSNLKKTKTKSKQKPKVRVTKALNSSNDTTDSTSSLAMDQCSPWTANEQNDDDSDDLSCKLEQSLTLQLEESQSPQMQPTSDHLDRSPQLPMATIDKKKMLLHRLRANIRNEMREEEEKQQ